MVIILILKCIYDSPSSQFPKVVYTCEKMHKGSCLQKRHQHTNYHYMAQPLLPPSAPEY